MKPGVRIGDPHTCPEQQPAAHVGGVVAGPGAATVLLEHQPGCVAGDLCACAGPPNLAVATSTTVLFCGKPAVRVGDPTGHGGVIVAGAATVLVGD